MAEPAAEKKAPTRARPQRSGRTGKSGKSGKTARARSSALPVALLAAVISVASALLAGAALRPDLFGRFAPGGGERAAAGEQRAQLAERLGEVERQLGELPDPRAAFAEELENIERAERELRGEMETLRDALLRDQSANQLERAERERELRAVTDALADLRAQILRGADRYRLAEIEHLLLLARRQLQFAGDAERAARALALAEQRLARFSGAAYRPVRAALAADIAALANYAAVDSGELLRELSRLAGEVDELPFADPAAPPAAAPAAPERDSSWWRALVRDVVADISSLVRIDTGAARAPLTPELRRALRERAKLMLESAGLALLRGRGELYASRLQDAHAHISENFDAGAPRSRAFLAELGALSARAPSAPPDISAALQILRETMRAAQ